MKKIFSVVALIALLLSSFCTFTACAPDDEETEPRTVVDMTGRTITLPDEVDSYIDLWYSHAPIMAMLDQSGAMKGCGFDPESDMSYWFYEICPFAEGCVVTEESMSAEEIIEMGVDVVFWENGKYEAVADQLIEAGIAAVNVSFSTYDDMKKSIRLTAEVLGTDYAKSQAEKFCNTLDSTISSISAKVATLSEDEKVTVMAFRDNKNYRTGALDTMEDCWITICGGINKTASETNQIGNVTPTMEQIVEWNPEYMFFRTWGCSDEFISDPNNAIFQAVENGNVHDTISGLFYWDACTVETILQLKYVSHMFYPDLFAETDMRNELKTFYKEFYNYDMSATNISNLLANGLPE